MSVLNISTIREECKSFFLTDNLNVLIRFKCSSCHFEVVDNDESSHGG
jgi:hypothetical protein